MTSPRAQVRDVPAVTGLVAAAAAGVSAGLLGSATREAPAALAELGLVAMSLTVAVLSLLRCRRALIARGRLAGVGSLVFSCGLPIAVAVPGIQLLAGWRTSKLALLGFEESNIAADVIAAYGAVLVAFAAYLAGELLVAGLRRDRLDGRRPPPPRRAWFHPQATFWVLVALGCVALLLAPNESRQEAFASRGDVIGQGPSQLLTNAWPVAVALGVKYGHWKSRVLALASVVLLGLEVVTVGTRTPLIVVGAAVLIRTLRRARDWRSPLRAVATGVMLGYTALVLVIAISDWRGDVSNGRHASLVASIGRSAANPLAGLSRGGVDTLDGLILAMKVDRRAVGASWTDPAKAITTFVPRKLWPSKPAFLSSTVTQYYTDFGGNAGIFLSGPGYGIVAFGGVLGMAAFFVLLGVAVGAAFERVAPMSMPAVLLTYFLLRFFFGGDAFDAFHALGLGLLVLFASGVAWCLHLLLPSRPRASPAQA